MPCRELSLENRGNLCDAQRDSSRRDTRGPRKPLRRSWPACRLGTDSSFNGRWQLRGGRSWQLRPSISRALGGGRDFVTSMSCRRVPRSRKATGATWSELARGFPDHPPSKLNRPSAAGSSHSPPTGGSPRNWRAPFAGAGAVRRATPLKNCPRLWPPEGYPLRFRDKRSWLGCGE